MDIRYMIRRTDMASMTVLTVIASVLIFSRIGFESLWEDEGMTYYYAYLLDPIFSFLRSDPGAPVGFYTLERIMLCVFGINEISLRFIPCAFGVLCIPSMYVLSRRFGIERICSALISLVLLTSVPFVVQAGYARPYTSALFFVIWISYFAADVLERGDERSWKGFMVTSAVSMYFFYTMFIPIGAYLLWFMLRDAVVYDGDGKRRIHWENAKPVLKRTQRIVLYASPAIFEFFVATFFYANMSNIGYASGLRFFPAILSYLFQDSVPLIVLALCLTAAGIVSMRDMDRRRMVVFAYAVIVILLFVMSLRRLYPRYTLYTLPVMLLIMAHGAVSERMTMKIITSAGISLMVMMTAILLPPIFEQHSEPDYRGAYGYVSSNALEGDIMIVVPDEDGVKYTIQFYYDGDANRTVTMHLASTADEIDALVDGHPGSACYVVANASCTDDDVYSVLTPEKLAWRNEDMTVFVL